jgi:hypothetical protein
MTASIDDTVNDNDNDFPSYYTMAQLLLLLVLGSALLCLVTQVIVNVLSVWTSMRAWNLVKQQQQQPTAQETGEWAVPGMIQTHSPKRRPRQRLRAKLRDSQVTSPQPSSSNTSSTSSPLLTAAATTAVAVALVTSETTASTSRYSDENEDNTVDVN